MASIVLAPALTLSSEPDDPAGRSAPVLPLVGWVPAAPVAPVDPATCVLLAALVGCEVGVIGSANGFSCVT